MAYKITFNNFEENANIESNSLVEWKNAKLEKFSQRNYTPFKLMVQTWSDKFNFMVCLFSSLNCLVVTGCHPSPCPNC